MIHKQGYCLGANEGCSSVGVVAERPMELATTHTESWQDGIALLLDCVAALRPVANQHLLAERRRGHVVRQGLLAFVHP